MKKLAALLLALTLTLGLVGCGNSAVGDVSGSTPPAAPSVTPRATAPPQGGAFWR